MLMPKHSTHTDSLHFFSIQKEFTQHIRNPEAQNNSIDIEGRRMRIYRDLLYNNIEGFLSSGFPVIREIYSDDDWHRMVRDFFIIHRCKTPYFFKIAEEFLDYLQNKRIPQASDPVGLTELAHYEWMELALSISDEKINYEEIDFHGDFLQKHPVLSPLAWPLAYQYPVHKMSINYLPDKIPETITYLVVYRDKFDEIKFMEINNVTAHMLIQLRDSPDITGREVLLGMANTLNALNVDQVIKMGLESLRKLQARGILLGTRG